MQVLVLYVVPEGGSLRDGVTLGVAAVARQLRANAVLVTMVPWFLLLLLLSRLSPPLEVLEPLISATIGVAPPLEEVGSSALVRVWS